MSGNKILVFEDNGLNLELATDLLEANDFVVYSAQTAEEGLRMAREILPDLVLMDLGLPGMDGLCATKELKANPATRHLTKPINTRTFIETIRRFIASAKSPRGIILPASGGVALPAIPQGGRQTTNNPLGRKNHGG